MRYFLVDLDTSGSEVWFPVVLSEDRIWAAREELSGFALPGPLPLPQIRLWLKTAVVGDRLEFELPLYSGSLTLLTCGRRPVLTQIDCRNTTVAGTEQG